MAIRVTVDTLLERVKDIAPMFRAHAAQAEAQRRLARPVVDAMLQAGLYSMSHPKAFGGLEVDPLTMFRVVEDVAYQGSAAGGICKCPLAPAVSWRGCLMRARRRS